MAMSFWKLLRLGDRAKRIVDRRGPESPAVASYGLTVHAKVDAFATAREAVTSYEATWRVSMSSGRTSLAALLKVERAWVPLVLRDCPGVTNATFLPDTTVPDDLLKGADRLVLFITGYVDEANKPLPYQVPALAALTPVLADTRAAVTKSEAADANFQKLQKDARAAATELDAELIAFRRTLLATFGKEDKDYQRLRAEKVAHKEATDPTDASAPTDAGTATTDAGAKTVTNGAATTTAPIATAKA